MPDTHTKISIIGGGASVSLLLAHLARGTKKLSVDVYDRTGRFARGIAYSTTRMCHLLNVRASNMSGIEEDRGHFASWAGGFGYAPTDFVPRKLYGDYLQSLWDEASRVLSINKIKADIQQASGEGIWVQATGNVRPLAPAVSGNPKFYFADPWALPDDLKFLQNIALIGSGLTAVDAILSLEDMGFKGVVTILSRHALLPLPHTTPQSWVTGVKPGLSPLQILKILRAEAANTQGVEWQAVIDSIRPLTNDIWAEFTDAQKFQFQRHLYTLWGVHRHRMAPQIAKTLERIKPSFVKSRVKLIEDGIKITADDNQIYTADAVINCMGYRYSEKGRDYAADYRIGPANFGELFETTAIPEIRAQANVIARKILSA